MSLQDLRGSLGENTLPQDPTETQQLFQQLGVNKFVNICKKAYAMYTKEEKKDLSLRYIQGLYLKEARIRWELLRPALEKEYGDILDVLESDRKSVIDAFLTAVSKLAVFTKRPRNVPFTDIESFRAINRLIKLSYSYVEQLCDRKEFEFISNVMYISFAFFFGSVYQNRSKSYPPPPINLNKKIFQTLNPVFTNRPITTVPLLGKHLLDIELKPFIERDNPNPNMNLTVPIVSAVTLQQFQLLEVPLYKSEYEFSEILGHILKPIVVLLTGHVLRSQLKADNFTPALIPDYTADHAFTVEVKRNEVISPNKIQDDATLNVINQMFDSSLGAGCRLSYLFSPETVMSLGIQNENILEQVFHAGDGQVEFVEVNLDIRKFELKSGTVNSIAAWVLLHRQIEALSFRHVFNLPPDRHHHLISGNVFLNVPSLECRRNVNRE